MKLKKFFWDYLYFTQIERYGIVFLLAFCLALFAVPQLYSRFFTRQDDHPEDQVMALPVSVKHEITAEKNGKSPQSFRFNPNTASLEDFVALGLSEKTAKSILHYRSKGGVFRKAADFSKIYTLSSADFQRLEPLISMGEEQPTPRREDLEDDIQVPSPVTPSPFDPNTVTAAQLKQLGLPQNTINGWLKYLEKGGKFRYKEDIQRLYSLTPGDYERLLPAVLLPSKENTTALAPVTYSGSSFKKTAVASIDINHADKSQWVNLPGIGEGWARKILNWRDKLGGFSSVDQVAETRFLPDSVFQKVKPFLTCPSPELQQISINTADWQTLNDHPYIETKHTRWIIAYREQHGPYGSLEDLLKIPEIKADWLQKLRPYLSI